MTAADTERLALARRAVVDAGYFTEAEVGEDVAPRIIEMLTAIRDGKWDGEQKVAEQAVQMCACPAWNTPHVRTAAIGCPPVESVSLLTADEHMAINLAGRLAGVLARIIGVDDPGHPNADADMREMVAPIHAIQNALLAQAGARAYPDRYRLMGETLRVEEDS